MSTPTGPDHGAPGLFDASPPRVERRAAPAVPRPAPLVYVNPETGAVLVSLDEARSWAVVEISDSTGWTVSRPLDTPPGGLEWCLAELVVGYRSPLLPG